MSGKYSQTTIPGFSVGVTTLTSKQIANNIVRSYPNCNTDFRSIKDSAETFLLCFTPRAVGAFDVIFTVDKLLAALDRCRNTFPGHNNIHNEMLSHLPFAGKAFQLSAYNSMWTQSLVPDA
jgi:hypothetical protein